MLTSAGALLALGSKQAAAAAELPALRRCEAGPTGADAPAKNKDKSASGAQLPRSPARSPLRQHTFSTKRRSGCPRDRWRWVWSRVPMQTPITAAVCWRCRAMAPPAAGAAQGRAAAPARHCRRRWEPP